MIKKMHASEQQKNASRLKMLAKLKVLNEWSKGKLPWQTDSEGKFIRDDNGDKIVELFPRNGKQFCDWTGSECSIGTRKILPELASISRQTFSQGYNEDIKSQAEDLFKVLIALREKMKASASNASEIGKLKREIAYWQAAAHAEANALLDMMQRLNEIDKLYKKAERVRKNNEEQLQTQIATLKAENAELNKILAKVTSLKGFK